jgi:hypothetical protein
MAGRDLLPLGEPSHGGKDAIMKTATALTLIAIGAILAFAVTWQPSFFNLHIAGWILMLVGGIGLVVPRRRYGFLRKRIVRRGTPAKQQVDIEEVTVEPTFSPLLAPGGINTVDGSFSDPATDQPPLTPR